MSPFRRLYLQILAFLIFLLAQSSTITESQSPPRLLVLFIDGFRWDYLNNLSKLPNFRRIFQNGATVERIKPVFPTDCYPNIYSIFTGALPTEHGVLFNEMYSSANGDAFEHENAKTRQNASKWVHADTLWQKLATQAGGRRRSYLHHLPTCVSTAGNDSFNGNECVPYNRSEMTIPDLGRGLNEAMRKLVEEDYHLAVVYHDSIDQLAHRFGPLSTQITEDILPEMDRLLGAILDQIDGHPEANVHLVVISDHGLAQTDKSIRIDRSIYQDETKEMKNRGTTIALWLNSENLLAQQLIRFKQMPNRKFDFYTAATLPLAWRVSEKFQEYFPSFYLIAHPGYVFSSQIGGIETKSQRRGWHGYDPNHEEMHTPLLVYGSRARPGIRMLGASPVEAVNVYHLLAELMHLPDSQGGLVLGKTLLHSRVDSESTATASLLYMANWLFSSVMYLLIFVLGVIAGLSIGWSRRSRLCERVSTVNDGGGPKQHFYDNKALLMSH